MTTNIRVLPWCLLITIWAGCIPAGADAQSKVGTTAAQFLGVPVGPRAITSLGTQAAYLGTPAELRAGCTWAVAEHDLARGGWLAGTLLADEEAAFWLASIVARRGGRLRPVVAGLPARPELDRVATLLAA